MTPSTGLCSNKYRLAHGGTKCSKSIVWHKNGQWPEWVRFQITALETNSRHRCCWTVWSCSKGADRKRKSVLLILLCIGGEGWSLRSTKLLDMSTLQRLTASHEVHAEPFFWVRSQRIFENKISLVDGSMIKSVRVLQTSGRFVLQQRQEETECTVSTNFTFVLLQHPSM